ncbi:hypothetical protein BH10BDE1_BH10BDE1_32200 [soil metagenome]
MQNQSRIFWIGLIIAIALGLSIEFLKSARRAGESSSGARLFGMNNLDDGDTTLVKSERSEKSRDQADRARTRLLRGRLAGLTNAATITPVPAAIVAAANSGVPNLGTPVAINTDDAKKKAAEKAVEDAKKKKKKKKKKAATPDVAQQPPSPVSMPDSDSSTNKSSDVSGASGSYGAGGSSHSRTIIGSKPPLNENPETVDQWLAFILREPSYERTMKMIEAQQQHSIDSDIFHEVVTQMLSDSRQKMHEYAVLALGSAPSLRSFLLLEAANVAQADGSALKIQSRNYIKAYSRIENIRYLGSAIAGTLEAAVAYEALRLIQVAVANYTPKAAPSTGSTVSTSAVVAKQFTSLVPALTRMQTAATDATVRQEATAALRDVNALLGTTAAAVVTAGN